MEARKALAEEDNCLGSPKCSRIDDHFLGTVGYAESLEPEVGRPLRAVRWEMQPALADSQWSYWLEEEGPDNKLTLQIRKTQNGARRKGVRRW